MSNGYVSPFPGTDTVDAAKVFAAPGYHEQNRKISSLVVAIFVGSIFSVVPLFGSGFSLITLPASLILYASRQQNPAKLPGEMLLRASVGLSVLGFCIGIDTAILMIIASGSPN